MININMATYPDNEPKLLPNNLVIDAGYSSNNYQALFELAKANVAHQPYTDSFLGFFSLYDSLKLAIPLARNALPDFGYSPYNLMLLINSLCLHKEQYAKLINCSFSKVLANTAHRNNAYFKPMVGNQWCDFLACYSDMVICSDKRHNLEHQIDSLFFMSADKALPLKIPKLVG